MLLPVPPMSNAERQRIFQLCNPGYDRRRKAHKRAIAKRRREQLRAEWRQAARADAAAAQAPVIRPMLMLPAPIEDPTLVELNALAAGLKTRIEERG